MELALLTTKNKCWEKRKGGKIWSRETKKEKKYEGKNVHNSPFWNFHNLELLHSPEASQVPTGVHPLVEQCLEGSVDDGVVSHFLCWQARMSLNASAGKQTATARPLPAYQEVALSSTSRKSSPKVKVIHILVGTISYENLSMIHNVYLSSLSTNLYI